MQHIQPIAGPATSEPIDGCVFYLEDGNVLTPSSGDHLLSGPGNSRPPYPEKDTLVQRLDYR
jgi:hypothetical protein